jgi:phenylpropionate dioxygenase-like ring-hydroxylating dioxygenase large terminal subunit
MISTAPEPPEADDLPEAIPDQWYAVARAESLGRKRPLALTRLGQRLVLWRDGAGVARAAPAACPHRGADLGLGRVVDGELECPYHGFRYASDGRCTRMPCEGRDARIPATLRVDPLPLREAHGFLWLWHGAARAPLPEVPWVPGTPDASVGSAADDQVWDVRLSRVMEGMLDLHHFPFAHRRYSPRIERLDPYQVTVEDGRIHAVGVLRREEQPADKGYRFELTAAFPGVVSIGFGKRMRGVVTCTPVDDEHTWIGFRLHQRWLPIPLLGPLLARLFVWSELRFIQPDDHRMLRSTEPRGSTPRRNHFVRADRAIAEWHRLRLAACKAAGRPPGLRPAAS